MVKILTENSLIRAFTIITNCVFQCKEVRWVVLFRHSGSLNGEFRKKMTGHLSFCVNCVTFRLHVANICIYFMLIGLR